MRSLFAKVGVLCLVLVVALASLGVGFAKWTTDLTIEGTVQTTGLNVTFSYIGCCGHNLPGYENVGCCSVEGEAGDTTLIVTILNGYPCYSCDVCYTIKNEGLIPVEVTGVEINGTCVGSGDTVTINGIAFTHTGLVDEEGNWIVLESNEESACSNLHIHVTQEAEQNMDELAFTLKIKSEQWVDP